MKGPDQQSASKLEAFKRLTILTHSVCSLFFPGMLRYCREERARIAKEEEELQRSITKQRRTGNLTDFLDHSKVENSNEKWYKRRRDKSDSYSGRFSSVLDSNSGEFCFICY